MDEVWKEDNNTFCIMPFSHFSPRADGQIKLCSDCLPMIGIPKTGTEDQMVVANEGDSREIPGVKTFNLFAGDSIEDIWNSEFYKDIRRKMLSGKRVTICQQCYLDDERSKHVENLIKNNFDLSPRGIREMLSLNKPIYECTAAYGHFGRKPRSDGSFSWEKTDKTAVFKK